MHKEAFDFLQRAIGWLGNTSGLRVVEFGSHDVNGSPRKMFKDVIEYVGVDPWAGVGVDVVCKAQEFDGKGRFDVCISAETLEHDEDAPGQIRSAWNALRPGGKLIITCAAPDRKPHRCDGMEADLGNEWYENITIPKMFTMLEGWKHIQVTHNLPHGDIYATAVKP